LKKSLVFLFFALIFITVYKYINLVYKIPATRAAQYNYNSEHEKFYQFAEIEQKNRVNIKEIFILNSSQNDCWFRYYILFLTGAESRTFDELLKYNPTANTLQTKYNKLFFVIDKSDNLPDIMIPHTFQNVGNFQVLVLETNSLNKDYLNTLKFWVLNNLHKEIYTSNLSCSWLLPK
jgi:hypothetical protein